MSCLEQLIVDLVQIAEAPLYSTYRWVGRQLGRDVQLSEFLRVTAEGIERDVLRLWSVDAGTGQRTELFEIPSDLEHRYAADPSLDDRYDPFGLSMTLGPAADVNAEPEWEFTLDFHELAFEVIALPDCEEQALGQLERCYPDLRVLVTTREDDGSRRRLVGVFSDAPHA